MLYTLVMYPYLTPLCFCGICLHIHSVIICPFLTPKALVVCIGLHLFLLGCTHLSHLRLAEVTLSRL